MSQASNRGGHRSGQTGDSQARKIRGIVTEALAQAGIRVAPNRFPTMLYSELPELPLGKGAVSTFLHVLDEMHSREAPVAAIALADIFAGHRSQHTGYAMKKRTDFLLSIGRIEVATHSARQYQETAPQMDSRKAETTADLCWAELQILRFYQGAEPNWRNLTQTLQFAASEFRQLPSCTKREGSARSLLALIYLRQWQQLRRQRGRESEADITYAKFTNELRAAVVLIGTGYHIPDAVEMVGAIDQSIVDQTLAGTEATHGHHITSRPTASAHA